MKGALAGLALGLASGALTHGLVARVKNAGDKIFYGVWAAGFFIRLLSVGAVFFYLYRRPWLPVVPVTLAMVLGQMAVQLIPIRPQKTGRTKTKV